MVDPKELDLLNRLFSAIVGALELQEPLTRKRLEAALLAGRTRYEWEPHRARVYIDEELLVEIDLVVSPDPARN